jgi:muramoyltetrapeptide carboxypeptidase
VRGLALGEFTQCEEPEADYTGAEVVADLARETGLPCAAGLPIGHGAVNVPVPLGVRVRLDGHAGTLIFLEPAVTPA